MNKSNIVLIGMPSSGKTTVGKYLSEIMGMEFIDTDQLIKDTADKPLKEIVNTEGLKKFLELQQTVILKMKVQNHVIATGGGVIYGKESMDYLKATGVIIFLKTELSQIESRITPDRRFARNDGQSLADLYHERLPLYQKHADITIDCDDKTVEKVAKEIEDSIKDLI